MKIKMRTLSAGPDGVMDVGKIYTVSVEEARQLVDGRYAEALEPFPESDKQAKPPENINPPEGTENTGTTKPPETKEDGEVNGDKEDSKSK